jgi:hypothetical protein
VGVSPLTRRPAAVIGPTSCRVEPEGGGPAPRAHRARSYRWPRRIEWCWWIEEPDKPSRSRGLRGQGSNLQASGSKVRSGPSPRMVPPGLSCFFTSGSAVLEVDLGDGWRQLLSKKLSNSTLSDGSAAWLDRPQHGAAGSTIAHMG